MIILDTNIVSELMKTQPDEGVLSWFSELSTQAIMITSITVAELRYGVAVLPNGKRRTRLDTLITEMIDEDFESSILDFNRHAGEAYGLLAAELKNKGIGVGQNDVMIASIAVVNEATLATRNEKDFEHCGINIINPFSRPMQ